jgi:hypothetical protein
MRKEQSSCDVLQSHFCDVLSLYIFSLTKTSCISVRDNADCRELEAVIIMGQNSVPNNFKSCNLHKNKQQIIFKERYVKKILQLRNLPMIMINTKDVQSVASKSSPHPGSLFVRRAYFIKLTPVYTRTVITALTSLLISSKCRHLCQGCSRDKNVFLGTHWIMSQLQNL